jgi:hypothetical protein
MTKFAHRLAGEPPSFTNKAVATLVIYWMFWIPGFVANLLFLSEAKAAERRWGRSLPGVGFLTVLLQVQIILAILGLFALTWFIAWFRSGG